MEKLSGCVYFFRHIGLTPVKIGYSESESPFDRFSQFKTYAPYGGELIGFIRSGGAKELETALHLKYAGHRVNGEWFEISDEQINYEINFHSKIEAIRQQNEFQQYWAKHIKGVYDEIEKSKIIQIPKKERFKNMYVADRNINRSSVARTLEISRQTVNRWIKEFNNK